MSFPGARVKREKKRKMRTEPWVERKPKNREQVYEGDEGQQGYWKGSELALVGGCRYVFPSRVLTAIG